MIACFCTLIVPYLYYVFYSSTNIFSSSINCSHNAKQYIYIYEEEEEEGKECDYEEENRMLLLQQTKHKKVAVMY